MPSSQIPSVPLRALVLVGSAGLVVIAAFRLPQNPASVPLWALGAVGFGLAWIAGQSLLRGLRSRVASATHPFTDSTSETSSDSISPHSETSALILEPPILSPEALADRRLELEAPAFALQGPPAERAPSLPPPASAPSEPSEPAQGSRPSGTQIKGPLEIDVLAGYRALARDRAGFIEFCRETDARVRELLAGDLSELRIRTALRTLSARAATHEISGLSEIALRLERTFLEGRRLPSAAELEELGEHFGRWFEAIFSNIEETGEELVELGPDEFEAILDRLRAGDEPALIEKELTLLRAEPIERRFRALRAQIGHLARRYGHEKLQIELHGGGVRIARERFGGIWGALVHAIENALEHGLEPGAERLARGKPETGKLSVRARMETNACIVEVSDDGRGVDWKDVTARGRALRMPHVSREDLVEVLFSPGFSTRKMAHAYAGHGFGLLAIREACQELHGNVLLISSPQRGTTIRISIPMRGGEIPFMLSTAPGPRSLRSPFVSAAPHKRITGTDASPE